MNKSENIMEMWTKEISRGDQGFWEELKNQGKETNPKLRELHPT